jgi:hypothetical protein
MSLFEIKNYLAKNHKFFYDEIDFLNQIMIKFIQMMMKKKIIMIHMQN